MHELFACLAGVLYLRFHIERCSFPNWNGTDQLRLITSLTAKDKCRNT
jgi:hypothetical protein